MNGPAQPKLKCPHCGEYMSMVLDGRCTPWADFRRRRRCQSCNRIYTTTERVDPLKPSPPEKTPSHHI